LSHSSEGLESLLTPKHFFRIYRPHLRPVTKNRAVRR
jgi:hypothetical protein